MDKTRTDADKRDIYFKCYDYYVELELKENFKWIFIV